MSRFSSRRENLPLDQSDEVLPLDCHCPHCGRAFNGSDRSGGHCSPITGGCCESFRSLHAFTKHLTGHYNDGHPQCLTPEQMLAKGWTVDDNHTWRTPAPATSPWKKDQ